MILLRFVVVLGVVLTIIYVSVSLYSRARRRDKLEQQWKENGGSEDRRSFVQRGLEQYDNSIRRKLILGVYIVPLVAIGVLIYVSNYG